MNEKSTLVIMGSHPKTIKLFDWTRNDCEIWLFNEAPRAVDEKGNPKYPKCDAFFQMHHPAIWKNPKNRSDNKHYAWLKSGNTPPVYMQDAYNEIPKAIRYPIDEVLSMVKNIKMSVNGKNKKFRYFTSSPDYALALAAYLHKYKKGYRKIEIWGIELETESEVYFNQRTGLGFWLGYLSALGVEIVFNGSVFDEPMYGYEGDIELPSKIIEKRIKDLTSELGDDQKKYVKNAQEFLSNLQRLVNKDPQKEIETELNEIIKENEHAALLNGKIQESKRYLEKALAMESASGTAVFAAGEFDGARLGYSKQQLQTQLEIANLNALASMQLKRIVEIEKGSENRKKAVNEYGHALAEIMNKNMILLHIKGAILDNQYYLESCKQSLRLTKKQ